MKLRRRRRSALARRAESPAVRLLATSAALAGGVAAVAKLATVRRKGQARGQRKDRYRLKPHETPKQGVSRVARGELDLTIGLLEAAPNGDAGAEAIHEARKALKRLRTLLRVSRPALDERRYQRESVIFRDAGRELSDARDAHVLVATLDSLLTSFAKELPEGAWARLREELVAGTERANGNGPTDFGGVVDLLSDARMRVSSWPLPSENGRATLAEGFQQIYRRGRRALRRAQKHPTPENFHELRKRAKDLWHSTQLLEPICPREMRPLSKEAHRLSDLLGDDHDLSVLTEYADRHPELLDENERGLLQIVVELRRQALRQKAMQCGESLYRLKPRRMLRQLALT